MKLKSKISILDPKVPFLEKVTYHKNGKIEINKVKNFDVEEGKDVTFISENSYCYKDGYFFIVKGKNHIHFMDSCNLEVIFESIL